MYTNFYIISNSLTFDDIIKMNRITYMFRDMNNVLTNNLQLLYKAKSYMGNLFYRIKVTTEKHFICQIQVQCCGTDYHKKIRKIIKLNNFKTIFK